MGNYTHFKFNATLKKEVPEALLDFIRYRLTSTKHLGQYLDQDIPFDNHPFFSCERWAHILTWHTCSGGDHNPWCRDTQDGLVLQIDTELKNYEQEIEWFLIWIAPMVNLQYPCSILNKSEHIYDEDDDKEEDCAGLIAKIQSVVQLNSAVGLDLLLKEGLISLP